MSSYNLVHKVCLICLFVSTALFAETVGLWGLNESSGTAAADSSSYSNSADLIGFTTLTWQLSDNTANGGYWANEIRLQPQGAYIDLGSGGELDITSSFTIECWIQVSQIDDYDRVFSRSGGGSEVVAVWLRNATTVQCQVNFPNGIKTAAWTGSALNDGNYHHIAARFDDTDNSLRVYVDGVQGSTVAYATSSDTVPVTGSWKVGARVLTSTASNALSGDIDEVRISNSPLSIAELGYNAGPLVTVVNVDKIKLRGSGSVYGMEILNSSVTSNGFTVETTGAEFVFDGSIGKMTINQKIGADRKLVDMFIGADTTNLQQQIINADHILFSSDNFNIGVYGDSTVIFESLDPTLTISYTGSFTPEYSHSAMGEILLLDGFGGVGVYPQNHETGFSLDSFDANGPAWQSQYTLQGGQRILTCAFPQRFFNEEQSYKQRVITTKAYPPDSAIEAWSKFANVIVLFDGLYSGNTWAGAQAWFDNHPSGYWSFGGPYQVADETELNRVTTKAHQLGMKVLLYSSVYFHYDHPDSDSYINDITQAWNSYDIDGFYVDGLYWEQDYIGGSTKIDEIKSWETMRRLRVMLGENGLLFYHGSATGTLDRDIYMPLLDTYADFVLYGENYDFSTYMPTESIAVNEHPHIKYVVRKKGISNTIGMVKVNISRPEWTYKKILDAMLEISNRERWGTYPSGGVYPEYPAWEMEQYFDALDLMELDYFSVAMWPLNRTSGNIAGDITSGMHDMVIEAAADNFLWQASNNDANMGDWKNEVRLNFLSRAGYFDIGSGGDLDITGSFTIEGWFQTGQINDYDRLFSRSGDGQESFAVWFRNPTTVQFMIAFAGGNRTAQWSDYSLDDAEYHHIAAVYNEDDSSLRVYVDGVEGSTVAYAPAGNSVPTIGNWRVGARVLNSSASNAFSGDVDEIRLSDKALALEDFGWSKGPFSSEVADISFKTDFDKNGIVDFTDFSVIAEKWLTDGN